MKLSKQLIFSCLISTGFFASGIIHADTCYDPESGSYFYCSGEEYAYPDNGGLVFNFGIGDYYDSGYRGGHHGGHHGGYHGHGGEHGHDGNHNGWQGGGGHHH
jgi:hypothetical protein